MARALADPWRVRILAELSVRPLSPSRFVEEVGGELTEIARYFRQLASWGYIKLVEERPGRRRGTAVEHVYKGIQRAYFNAVSWEGVPRSRRDQISRATVSSFVARVEEAVNARTFDAELDRHLSWDYGAIDQQAWQQLGRRLDAFLIWLSELEIEASHRLSGTDKERIPAIVALSSFRSPQSANEMLNASHFHRAVAVTADVDSFAIGPKLAKALSNQWRCRILMELTSRPMSPSQFVREIGGSKSHISRCFRELADWGYVEVFDERRGGRRRGGVELIYRNARRPHFDMESWITLPKIVREEMSQAFMNSYVQMVTSAIEKGTFDADVDRHFSWRPITLDRRAWAEVSEGLDGLLRWAPQLEADSLARSEGTVDRLIPTIAGFFSFRAPSTTQGIYDDLDPM
jgi:DNA-binding transcriptional ArsR family regulator